MGSRLGDVRGAGAIGDHGIVPLSRYSNIQFPRAIYLAWLLGKVFGWGHTLPLYAFDAGCVVFLGWMMVTWSRKPLGGAVPGLVGYLAFLNRYLNLRYEVIAQRDWYTAFLVCVGLLFMQTWPGRRARFASAAAAAMALVLRPHAVLFLPARLGGRARESCFRVGMDRQGANRRDVVPVVESVRTARVFAVNFRWSRR